MYRNQSLSVEVIIQNENEFEERLESIKQLFESGITLDKFELLVTNLSNGEQGRKPNESKSLPEWKTMFDDVNNGEEISEIEIQNFFYYIQKYYTMMIRENGKGSYQSLNRENIRLKDGFVLEYIIYKTLEL